ncbi:MAG: DUF2252 family protein [Bacteroidota bacterium]
MSSDIVQQIKDANKDRQRRPLEIKYKAMAESPFRFFRGTCQLFYAELFKQYPFPVSPAIWACGDLHIENFGSYKGSNRLVYFDMNDFDEALLAPALSEICRLAASVQIAAAESKFSRRKKDSLVSTLLHSYRDTLKKNKSIVIERGTARGFIKKLVTKVAERKEMDLVRKRTDEIKPEKLLMTDRMFPLEKSEKKSIISAFNTWLADNAHDNVKAIDAAFRIAGTGSIGVKRYILLVAYIHNTRKKLLIDVKEAMPPASRAYVNLVQPAWQNEAERVIAVQEMMEHVSPAFLSSFQHNENWFVVKELQPTADKVNLFQTIKQPDHMDNYLADLGMLTASGQLRSSGRHGSVTADELSHFAADDSWVYILTEWSGQYAEQVKQEYAVYKEAWQDGAFI